MSLSQPVAPTFAVQPGAKCRRYDRQLGRASGPAPLPQAPPACRRGPYGLVTGSPISRHRSALVERSRGIRRSAAITWHTAKADESAAYGAGMGSFVQVLAENIAKVRPPLPPVVPKAA